MVIKPPKLQKGDKISVVSPSSPITNDIKINLDKGINKLKKLGFEVVLAKNALSNSLGYSATPQEKALDINNAFADKSIKAIICSQGGENANSILSLLDYKLIKNNPKIFLGISDITVLLNAIYQQTELITFHGNDVIWGFGRNPTDYEINEFIDRLINGKIGVIKKNSEWKIIRGGISEGILIGGNLNCLSKLAGTSYFPEFSNKILFLEDYGEHYSADTANCEFHQMDQIGIFKQIKGLWFGHYKTKENFQYEDIAKEIIKKYNFPVIKCDDFGHNTSNTVIPIGVKIRLNGEKAKVEILENFLS